MSTHQQPARDHAYNAAVGARIREVRHSRRMSAPELQERAFGGDGWVQPGRLLSYESSNRSIRMDALVAIAEALDVHVAELLPDTPGSRPGAGPYTWREFAEFQRIARVREFYDPDWK